MKKSQSAKNSLIHICIFVCFIFALNCAPGEIFNKGAAAFAAAPLTTSTVKEKTSDAAKAPTSIPEENAIALKKAGEKGMKNTTFKFLMSMLGVLVSAIVIFFALTFYKKVVQNKALNPNYSSKNSLESPKDFKEAINLFLDKTDK